MKTDDVITGVVVGIFILCLLGFLAFRIFVV